MKKLSVLLIALLCVGKAMAQCSANFSTAYTPHNNALMEYTFTNLSTTGATGPGKNVFAHFSFGDGTGGSLLNPYMTTIAHNYAAPGPYTVTMDIAVYDSITHTYICKDTLVRTINVNPSPCAFSVAYTMVNDSTVAFSAVNAAGNPATNCVWHFGDGQNGTGANPTHVYAANGSYYVTVVDSSATCGYVNRTSVWINFLGNFSCDSIFKSIKVSAVKGTAYVSAFAHLNPGYTGKQLNFRYDYGDGSGITGSNQHTYSAVGSYKVTAYFTCSDSGSSTVYCRDTLVDSVRITKLYSELGGYILYDSINNPGMQTGVKVYLIVHDTAAGTLTAVDSLTTGGKTGIPYMFQDVPGGVYLVKAAWPGAVAGNTGIIPTYADSSLLWSNARRLYHNGISSTYNVNIRMRTGTQTGGPGFVGGLVSLGANKGTSAGAPGVSMILQDANGTVIAMTETDKTGRYEFSRLPVGTYTVTPELLNYSATASAPLTISASKDRITDLYFTQDDAKMSIQVAALGVPELHAALVSVSPNPAHGIVRVTTDRGAGGILPLELRDMTGKTVLRAAAPAGSTLMLDVRQLPAGLYFLHPGTGAPVKLVLQ